MNCHCGSTIPFTMCCEPYLNGTAFAPTPEALMRSRYTAYCVGNADYLFDTTYPTMRRFHKKTDLLDWSRQNKWVRLEVTLAKGSRVNFKAYYIDASGTPQVHAERSRFQQYNKRWYYLDGTFDV